MRVRLLLQLTGTRDGVRWPAPGGEVDLPDREGAKMCASGYAEPVAAKAAAEKATARKPETRKK
ncbi:MAG: hypothetical protein IPJ47_14590 [Anaerolineales bacterium]|nr:hypothetical protein [Anaerolineales bacterium]